MTGFNDLPNEIVLELWEQRVIQPDDIISFALVSKRIFAFATPFLRECHRLKSKYAVLENGAFAGSMWAHILKDILLHPYIALYIKEVSIYDWHTCWDDPDISSFYPNPPFKFHLPYLEQDVELFRSAIRKSKYVHPSEVDEWIKLLESGHEDPILALLLSLLPNLCTLSLEQHPPGTLLSTVIRRIAEAAPSTSLSRVRSVHLSDSTSGQIQDIAFMDPFFVLPSAPTYISRLSNLHFGTASMVKARTRLS